MVAGLIVPAYIPHHNAAAQAGHAVTIRAGVPKTKGS